MPGAEKEMLEGKEFPEEIDETTIITPEEDAVQIQDTLKEMAMGIGIFAIIFCIFFLIFGGERRVPLVLGLVMGAVVSELMLRHMYVTIGRAVDMDADSATKYTKKKATLRMLMSGAVLATALLVPSVFHVVGTLAGLFCLKFAAYIQPLTHKVLKSINKGR